MRTDPFVRPLVGKLCRVLRQLFVATRRCPAAAAAGHLDVGSDSTRYGAVTVTLRVSVANLPQPSVVVSVTT
jgi:hypothetical protein